MANPQNNERGRESVETRLINSACQLLAKNGPKTLTVRDIANHAGVNHGQVHHYFGGKRGLLKAAIRQLSDEHVTHHEDRGLDENSVPPPLTLSETQNYVMAIIRCIIDDDMELATLEIADGTSVPRKVLDAFAKETDSPQSLTELKAALAVSIAVEWSWAALGNFIKTLMDVQPGEEQIVIDAFAKASRIFLKNPELLK